MKALSVTTVIILMGSQTFAAGGGMNFGGSRQEADHVRQGYPSSSTQQPGSVTDEPTQRIQRAQQQTWAGAERRERGPSFEERVAAMKESYQRMNQFTICFEWFDPNDLNKTFDRAMMEVVSNSDRIQQSSFPNTGCKLIRRN